MEKKNERIFISYKRVDMERVDALKTKIEAATGEECWIDRTGIESDAQFVEVIMDAIDHCEIFLFMRSKEHNNITNHSTDWTIREVNYALSEKKRLVFVSLDNTPLPRWFKFMFPNQQEIDASDEEKLKKFYADLRSWLNVEETTREEERKAKGEDILDVVNSILIHKKKAQQKAEDKIKVADSLYHIGTFKRHRDLVRSAASIPDENKIVSTETHTTVKVWDAQTRECIRTIKGHKQTVNSTAFSPDGKRIVSASDDHTVKVWDAQTGECIRTIRGIFKGHACSVNSAAFSPDGKIIVSASNDHTVKVWNAKTGECIRTLKGIFKGHACSVNSAAFSPDGKRIVSASDDQTVKVWNAQTGECIKTIWEHKYKVHSAAFSPDGKRIV
jgi:WD40 repeat protein